MRFGLNEMGILGGPTPRGIPSVVELFRRCLNAKSAHLFIFDDERGELFVRASADPRRSTAVAKHLPSANSASARARHGRRTVYFKDLSAHPLETSAEHRVLGAKSFAGSIVSGPDSQPIGVLGAIDPEVKYWTVHETKRAEEMAYLINQQIMLRAALETLRIISRERSTI